VAFFFNIPLVKLFVFLITIDVIHFDFLLLICVVIPVKTNNLALEAKEKLIISPGTLEGMGRNLNLLMV
jgi:hypothetical protein